MLQNTKSQVNRKRHKPKANYLPTHIATAFQRSLADLISSLKPGEWSIPFKVTYLQDEFLSKYNDPNGLTASEKRDAAITKWLSVEDRNRTTNVRLFIDDEEKDLGWAKLQAVLNTARRTIARILGECEPAYILRGSCHTNGASTRVRRGSEAAIQKHLGKAHVSSSALKHWYTYAAGTQLSNQELQIQESSVLFTVPKNSEIDRVACKEPEINMLLQRCVGSAIRRALRKRAGINLNDQTINQGLAKDAWKDGLATIDLSSASDSVSSMLVRSLLPFDWWSLLDDLRVHSVEIPDPSGKGESTVHRLEMFSSMGNGFTFELESLIFYALTRAVAYHSGKKGKISVYGDDIICPTGIGARLARLFQYLGFKVNIKKSHWTGPFRESCGKHYHQGIDVTPFYLREPVSKITDVVRLLNRLYQWDAAALGYFCTPEIAVFHKQWAQIVPSRIHGGQDAESDSALVTGDPKRDRLICRTVSPGFSQYGGYLHWLTTREGSQEPFTVTSMKEVGYRFAPQPSWLCSTAWSIYPSWIDSSLARHAA